MAQRQFVAPPYLLSSSLPQCVSSCFNAGAQPLGGHHSVGGLKVMEIHAAVEGRAILSSPHFLEEGADGAPLLRVLVLLPRLVRHRRSAPIALPPARPGAIWRDISSDVIRPER